jgi:hypothetical protein
MDQSTKLTPKAKQILLYTEAAGLGPTELDALRRAKVVPLKVADLGAVALLDSSTSTAILKAALLSLSASGNNFAHNDFIIRLAKLTGSV